MPSNYAQGHTAEIVASDYLKDQGFEITDLNWKTRWCEIDIVARKNECVYFVEVKYRKTTNQGFGLDYITPKKLKQMQFAAEVWIASCGWLGEYQLAAVELSGDNFDVNQFVVI